MLFLNAAERNHRTSRAACERRETARAKSRHARMRARGEEGRDEQELGAARFRATQLPQIMNGGAAKASSFMPAVPAVGAPAGGDVRGAGEEKHLVRGLRPLPHGREQLAAFFLRQAIVPKQDARALGEAVDGREQAVPKSLIGDEPDARQ